MPNHQTTKLCDLNEHLQPAHNSREMAVNIAGFLTPEEHGVWCSDYARRWEYGLSSDGRLLWWLKNGVPIQMNKEKDQDQRLSEIESDLMRLMDLIPTNTAPVTNAPINLPQHGPVSDQLDNRSLQLHSRSALPSSPRWSAGVKPSRLSDLEHTAPLHHFEFFPSAHISGTPCAYPMYCSCMYLPVLPYYTPLASSPVPVTQVLTNYGPLG